MFRLIILFAMTFLGILSEPRKCKFSDKVCTKNLMNDFFKSIFEIDKLDPMYLDVIEGDLPHLKYVLKANTVNGYNDCYIEKANLNMEKLVLDTEIDCPGFTMNGDYEVEGHLLNIPVNGNGTYNIITKSYRVKFHANLNITDKGGNLFINMKDFTIIPEALENVVFEFKNLFNGQKDLSDAIHKVANENWKEAVKEIQGPAFDAAFKVLVQTGNKMFENQPLNKFLEF